MIEALERAGNAEEARRQGEEALSTQRADLEASLSELATLRDELTETLARAGAGATTALAHDFDPPGSPARASAGIGQCSSHKSPDAHHSDASSRRGASPAASGGPSLVHVKVDRDLAVAGPDKTGWWDVPVPEGRPAYDEQLAGRAEEQHR